MTTHMLVMNCVIERAKLVCPSEFVLAYNFNHYRYETCLTIRVQSGHLLSYTAFLACNDRHIVFEALFNRKIIRDGTRTFNLMHPSSIENAVSHLVDSIVMAYGSELCDVVSGI